MFYKVKVKISLISHGESEVDGIFGGRSDFDFGTTRTAEFSALHAGRIYPKEVPWRSVSQVGNECVNAVNMNVP